MSMDAEAMSRTFGINWPLVINPVYMPPSMFNPYTKEAQRFALEERERKAEAWRRKYPKKARAERAAYARTVKKMKEYYRRGGSALYSRRGTRKKTTKKKK